MRGIAMRRKLGKGLTRCARRPDGSRPSLRISFFCAVPFLTVSFWPVFRALFALLSSLPLSLSSTSGLLFYSQFARTRKIRHGSGRIPRFIARRVIRLVNDEPRRASPLFVFVTSRGQTSEKARASENSVGIEWKQWNPS